MKKRGLSKKAEKLISDFDEAARDWGWTSDQGSYEAACISEIDYNESYRKLRKYVFSLERKSVNSSTIMIELEKLFKGKKLKRLQELQETISMMIDNIKG